MQDPKEQIDVSVLLNCHNEDQYIETTIISLNEAMTAAQQFGVRVELVVVLDNPSEKLKNISVLLEGKNYPVTIKQVNNGSLGVSRNTALFLAKGKYVSTADADDMLSANFIVEAIALAEKNGTNGHDICYIPEYICSFGSRYGMTKYYSSKYFSPCDLYQFHPFCSRIFIKREILLQTLYKDLRKESGFAFEDWDLNRRLYLKNIEIAPVPGTLLFYRQRKNSIMSSNDFVRLPPPSLFTDPEIFLKSYRTFQRPIDFNHLRTERLKFAHIKTLLNYVLQANSIDPSFNIQPFLDGDIEIHKNLDPIYAHWGYRLPLLLLLTGEERYDDIFIISSLKKVDKDTFILKKIRKYYSVHINRKILVLSLENEDFNIGRQYLPENVFFLNFSAYSDDFLLDEKIELLVNFLLAICNENAKLHLLLSKWSNLLLERYGKSLFKMYYIYLYLSTSCYRTKGEEGIVDTLNVIRDYSNFVNYFIFDDLYHQAYFYTILGPLFKDHFIYFREKGQKVKRNSKNRLCWLQCSEENSVNLLDSVSKKLLALKSDIQIDVFGPSSLNKNDLENTNINYRCEDLSLEYVTSDGVFLCLIPFNLQRKDIALVRFLLDLGIQVIVGGEKVANLTALENSGVKFVEYSGSGMDAVSNSYVEKILRAIDYTEKMGAQKKAIIEAQQKKTLMNADYSQSLMEIRSRIFFALGKLPRTINNSTEVRFSFVVQDPGFSISSKQLHERSLHFESSVKFQINLIREIMMTLKSFPILFSFGKNIYRKSWVQSILNFLKIVR